MNQMKLLPTLCPSCSHALAIKRLSCPQCGTEVEGFYDLPVLASLSRDDQDFIVRFVSASGSLKEMTKILGVSYPTVRNRLDDIIARLGRLQDEREDGHE